MTNDPVYRSSNGDDWSFEPDGSGGGTVVHRANPSSGGRETRMPLQEFLDRGGGGPEVQAIRDASEKSKG